MKILSLETSTKTFSIAVSSQEKILAYRNIRLKKVLSSSIIPVIEKILKGLRMELRDLDAFAIALGPGSFTSLRVGLSTVKALAFASGKPVIGVPSPDVLARNVAGQDCDQVCTISDARRNLVYACLFERAGRAFVRISDYQLTELSRWLDHVKGRTIFIGDGVGLHREEILKAYAEAGQGTGHGCQALFADEKFWYPQARELAKIAYQRFVHQRFDDPARLVPLYLYSADCQITTTPSAIK
ncbi:MAG: tRNA (adenosine(37)-N6)-threonylcarbamoyltransferase complex dimerization subunit type 1 TsaB [Candidatus Omnitrophota bacterium]|nr:tRNA (adenosine(37)-N6)-threonylcarbamoyltransferase complex dimerization subunit type 1 TsaB [Candidatus Omnitrophota bacterium]MDZ4241825.1 tRNA (adenosine(37)-N6)-threonylcarbamoyltransferase complex dimerization subunit type 1 TsaB [Candidatus Omnitrophota bacterium]